MFPARQAVDAAGRLVSRTTGLAIGSTDPNVLATAPLASTSDSSAVIKNVANFITRPPGVIRDECGNAHRAPRARTAAGQYSLARWSSVARRSDPAAVGGRALPPRTETECQTPGVWNGSAATRRKEERSSADEHRVDRRFGRMLEERARWEHEGFTDAREREARSRQGPPEPLQLVRPSVPS